MSDPNLLVLVDGSSYLFRAYHGLPALTNSRGEPTGALFGVVTMLRKLIDTYSPQYMGVVFDAPGPTFRHELYTEYKAHRPPMPDDLRSQIEPLHRIVRALGLPLIMESGVEADDVIGTLARRALDEGLKVLISTGDKDLAQLVEERVTLINTMTDTLLDRNGVIAKFGVAPEQMRDYLALVGDSSDNIPGVAGCGPKTAAKWLAEYPDIDTLVANVGAIKGKVGDNLRGGLDQLRLSRDLTTIRCDLELPLKPEELRPSPPDVPVLREMYAWMEARKLLEGLERQSTPAAVALTPTPLPEGEGFSESAQAPIPTNYETILDEPTLDRWLERLSKADLFSIDTETTSLDYMQAEIVGLSFAIEPGEAAYLPVAHRYPGAPDQLNRDKVLAKLKPILEDPARRKVGQNPKYDLSVLARYDIKMAGISFDTMLESYVWNSTATRHDMDSLAGKYLGHKTITFEEVAGKGVHQIGFDDVPLEQATPYAAEDADITLRLHQALWPKLEAEPALKRLFQEIEMPLVPILSRIERTGVRIDMAMLREQSKFLSERMAELEAQAHRIAGHPFNLGSPKQIGEIFYQELGIPVRHRTPKGAPSTSEEALEALAEEHELPRVILDHRSLSKLRSTYTEKLPQMVNPKSGRVHTSYHQAVAATGRLSSSDPNLQNIPVRTEEGRRIRRAFVPEPGWRMVAADYSQIELRIMAHLSEDEGLLNAFAQGEDIHRATAAEVFGLTLDQVNSDQRRSAKAINFGLIYGMSAFGLAKQLGISRTDAQRYVDLYFERYPGVKRFMERIKGQAKAQGYVETLFGRRLHLPDINARNQAQRSAAERLAINAPMQGTAADIIKRAMITVDRWIEGEQPAVRMIMQVHDELVFEVREDQVEAAKERIRALMESAAELRVPLLVDVGEGSNWDEAH